MHMADALISPAVAGTMWVVSAGALAISAVGAKKAELDSCDEELRGVAMTGLLGAFVFAAQMINFTIPGTGSSGHIGGGMLLAVLLGPRRALVAMASVLLVQALFFADGGILAYGCNLFNMGVITAAVGYPLYRFLAGRGAGNTRATAACVAATVIALQLGAFAVVLETSISGVTALPFDIFALAMQSIHLAIGLVEGFATAAVVLYVRREFPDILNAAGLGESALSGSPSGSFRRVAAVFAIGAVLMGGVVAHFASAYPDGLEWSIARVAGGELEENPGIGEALQEKTAFLPDYNFRDASGSGPAAVVGTSVSGLAGAGITCAIVAAFYVLMRRSRGVRRA